MNFNYKQGKKLNPYLVQKIMSADSKQLTTYVYDAAILGCRQKNANRVVRATQELINNLNYDNKEIAVPMFDLYRYCIDRAHMKKFDDARVILEGLREAWIDLVNREKQQ